MKNIASRVRNIFLDVFFKIEKLLLAVSDLALLLKQDLRGTRCSVSLQLIASIADAAALYYLSESSISYRNGKGIRLMAGQDSNAYDLKGTCIKASMYQAAALNKVLDSDRKVEKLISIV